MKGIFKMATSFIHALAERRCTPAQCRANEALDRLSAVSDRIIATGSTGSTDPLRDALDNMAEHR